MEKAVGVLERSLQAIACSHAGISELELRTALEIDSPSFNLLWATIYFSIKPLIIDRSGLFTFAHDHIRQAVHFRYFSDPEKRLEMNRQVIIL